LVSYLHIYLRGWPELTWVNSMQIFGEGEAASKHRPAPANP